MGELCNETIELQDSVLVFEPEQISAKDGDQLNAPIGYVLEGGERNPLIICARLCMRDEYKQRKWASSLKVRFKGHSLFLMLNFMLSHQFNTTNIYRAV